jgi:hypothetical protein
VSCVQELTKLLNKVELEVWFDGGNESFNMEFLWNL